MRAIRYSFLTLFLSTSHLHGETVMNSAIDALTIRTDEVALAAMAKGIADVYEAVSAGTILASEGNAELFRVIASDPVAATVIYAGTNQSGQPASSKREIQISTETAEMIVNIKQSTQSFTQKVVPFVSDETSVTTYLRQVSAINVGLLSRSPEVFNPNQGLIENFKSYQGLIGPIENALGFNDYTATYERDAFFPSPDYFHGSHNYVSLFRGTDAEKAKSQSFVSYFDSLSPTEQLAAYAWVYDADFEAYLTVAPVPSDLPAWINSDALRTLHGTVNSAIMTEFEEEELEMIQ